MCKGGASCDLDKMVKTPDVTLADYLERKGYFKKVPQNDDKRWPKKKLTFEEWWQREDPPGDQQYWCTLAWKAAQENI